MSKENIIPFSPHLPHLFASLVPSEQAPQRVTFIAPKAHRESNRPGVVFGFYKNCRGTWVQFIFQISGDERRHVLVFHFLAVAVFWNALQA